MTTMMKDQKSSKAKSTPDETPKMGYSRLAWWESLFKALGSAIALFVAIAGLVSVRCVASQQKALAGEQKELSGTQQAIREQQVSLDYINHLNLINALRGGCSRPETVLVFQPTDPSTWRLWGNYIECFNNKMAGQNMADIEGARLAACAAHLDCNGEFESLQGVHKQFRMPPGLP